MTARETIYNGVLYRSRLEARWAIFFDVVGVEFQYEPKQFLTGEGLYLPDFYLPTLRMWIEIKPATGKGPTPEEILKMRDVADTESKVGFILCGFPAIKNGWIDYVIFVPGMRPATSGMTWRHQIREIDLDLYVSAAIATTTSRENRNHETSLIDGVFKLLVSMSVIDRYRHNAAMQKNIAEKNKGAASEARKHDFMTPLRDFIFELACEINRYAMQANRSAA